MSLTDLIHAYIEHSKENSKDLQLELCDAMDYILDVMELAKTLEK